MLSQKKHPFKNEKKSFLRKVKDYISQFLKKILKILFIVYLLSYQIPIEFIEFIQEFVNNYYDD
jgi:hypothetical protein